MNTNHDDDDDDDDDEPDIIPTYHLGFCPLGFCPLGFCPLGFILHTMMMMMPIHILLNISNLYADADARSMTPSRNTRSYTLRSVPSSPGRSFL